MVVGDLWSGRSHRWDISIEVRKFAKLVTKLTNSRSNVRNSTYCTYVEFIPSRNSQRKCRDNRPYTADQPACPTRSCQSCTFLSCLNCKSARRLYLSIFRSRTFGKWLDHDCSVHRKKQIANNTFQKWTCILGLNESPRYLKEIEEEKKSIGEDNINWRGQHEYSSTFFCKPCSRFVEINRLDITGIQVMIYWNVLNATEIFYRKVAYAR